MLFQGTFDTASQDWASHYGIDTINKFIRQHAAMLRHKGTAKNGLDLDIFSCKCLHFGECKIILAVHMV